MRCSGQGRGEVNGETVRKVWPADQAADQTEEGGGGGVTQELGLHLRDTKMKGKGVPPPEDQPPTTSTSVRKNKCAPLIVNLDSGVEKRPHKKVPADKRYQAGVSR